MKLRLWWWVCAGLVVLGTGCGDEASPSGQEATVECRLHSDCPIGQRCEEGACVEGPAACEGDACPCSGDDACTPGEICDISTGECVAAECTSDAGCALGQVCVRQRCLTDVNADRDRDGVPDIEDRCPDVADAAQEDLDGDGLGDACDVDDDDDDVPDSIDNCPRDANPAEGTLQPDRDGDGQGDACEGDIDSDGVPDDIDVCPRQHDPSQVDTDQDGLGDACDADDDDDGVFDDVDRCPLLRDDQTDADGDGVGNACDPDWAGVTIRGRLVSSASNGADFTRAELRVIGPELREEVVNAQSDGTFLFEHWVRRPGLYVLDVRLTGFVVQPAPAPFFIDGGAEAISLEDVRLRHESELVSTAVPLTGRVRLPLVGGNEPDHGGTVIYLYRLPELLLFASEVTDHDGTFSVGASPNERYELRVRRDGYAPETRGPLRWNVDQSGFIEEGGGPLDVRLTRSPLQGSVVIDVGVWPGWLPRGQRDMQVTLTGPGRSETRSVRLNDVIEGQPPLCGSPLCGELAWSDELEAGRYTVVLNRAGFEPVSASVELSVSNPTGRVALTTRLNNLGAASMNLRAVDVPATDLRQIEVLRNAPLSGVRLVGSEGAPPDLSCLDLRGADLSQTDLRDAIFEGTSLVDGRFFNATLDRASFIARSCPPCDGQDPLCQPSNRVVHDGLTDLSGASFTAASLVDARLGTGPGDPLPLPCAGPQGRGVQVAGARFSFSDLNGAALGGVDLSGVDLSNASMVETWFGGACMVGTSLVLSNLDRTRFDRANLRSALMVGTVFLNARLDDAVLQYARIDAAVVLGGSWRGADMRDASLVGAVFADGVEFADTNPPPGCVLPPDCPSGERAACLNEPDPNTPSERTQHPELARACRLTTFQRANLFDIAFSNVDLSGVSFRGASLNSASFSGVSFVRALGAADPCQQRAVALIPDFSRADMSLVYLGESELCFSEMLGVTLDGADLSGSLLRGVRLSNVDHAACLAAFQFTPEACRDPRWCPSPEACLGPDVCPSDIGLLRAQCRADHLWPSLRGARFDHAALEGVELGGADMSRASLLDATLSQTSLEAVQLDGAVLTRSSMRNLSIMDTTACGAVFDAADLFGARIERSVLSVCGEGAQRFQPSMVGVDLSAATLLHVDLRESNLRGADLSGARLAHVNLERADAAGVLGEGTQIDYVRMDGATLQGARFAIGTYALRPSEPARLHHVSMSVVDKESPLLSRPECFDPNGKFICQGVVGAPSLSGATFEDVELMYADLSWSDLSDVSIRRSELYEVDASRTWLEDADLTDDYIRRTSFAGGTLRRVDFRPTGRGGPSLPFSPRLEQVSWEGARLRDVDFGGTTLSIVDLDRAILSRTSFVDATFDGASFELASCDACDFTRAEVAGVVLWDTRLTGTLMRDTAFIESYLEGVSWDAATDWTGVTFDADCYCPDGSSAVDNPNCGF